MVREYGFLGVVVDTTNLEGSIWGRVAKFLAFTPR